MLNVKQRNVHGHGSFKVKQTTLFTLFEIFDLPNQSVISIMSSLRLTLGGQRWPRDDSLICGSQSLGSHATWVWVIRDDWDDRVCFTRANQEEEFPSVGPVTQAIHEGVNTAVEQTEHDCKMVPRTSEFRDTKFGQNVWHLIWDKTHGQANGHQGAHEAQADLSPFTVSSRLNVSDWWRWTAQYGVQMPKCCHGNEEGKKSSDSAI